MASRPYIAIALLLMAGMDSFVLGQPLATGVWGKFSVTEDGVYKIDFSLLKKAGFDPGQLNPHNIHVFGNGTGMLPQANSAPRQNQLKELAIFVQGESDGKFDPADFILFFGQGPDEYHFDVASKSFEYQNNLYSEKNFYFLTVDSDPGKRLAPSRNVPGSYPVINQYDDFGYYESDQYNILTSGRKWFGDELGSTSNVTLQFKMAGIVDNTPIKFTSHVMAQSYTQASNFQIFFNSVQILQQEIDTIENAQYAIKGIERADTVVISSTLVSAPGLSTQNVKYQFNKGSGPSIGYLDYFIFSLKRNLAFNKAQLIFTAAESTSNAISTYELAGLPSAGSVWDITDPFNPKSQDFQFENDHVAFSVTSDTLRKFTAFTDDEPTPPVFESNVANQNLAKLPTPDLLIVTHPDFLSEASRLASFRQSQDNLTTQVVSVQEIYNEYSGGKQDVTAIRDFVRDVYSRGGGGLDNLLLFGRCSYDYKNRVPSNTNFVPTYESRNSLSPLDTYSSDDYFAFLEPSEGEWPEDPAQDYSMEIGVGRISVVTIAQAKAVVDKLIDYETNADRFGPWRKNIVFVADDGDANIHQGQADALATNLDTAHAEFTSKKIYLDQYKQIMKPSGQYSPDAKDALLRALDVGAFVVNYTGHGSESVWAQEQILDLQLVLGLKNGPRYPLFVTATCVFGRHDDPFQISSGELLLLQPGGGGIGLVTTARPVNSGTNFDLNQAFYSALFKKTNGAYHDVGTVFRDTKNNSLSGVANRNFSLLGDPSLHLAFANDQIVLTQVRTASGSDTLKALSSVVVQGEIQRNGTKLTSFNGVAQINVVDRPVAYVTRGDENPPFTYSQLTSSLFRGNVAVTDGGFRAAFIVPENVEASAGIGKISSYAWSSHEDASGATKSIIGGVENPVPMPTGGGPSVRLFIGDTTFINGGIASPNTTLVMKLEAPNGISISETGGARNLMFVLDDSLSYELNSYFVATSGDSVGTVLFPLLNLSSGKHSVLAHAWDTFGNEVSGTVDFVVTDGNLEISSFYNYPNPFSSSGKTTFVFSHNRPGEDLDTSLTITDLTGRELMSEQIGVSSSFTEVTLVDWDGTTFAGNKIAAGIYLAKLSVRSLLDGSKNQQFAKLIIVN